MTRGAVKIAVYAAVVISLAHQRVNRPFDYRVPPDLEQKVHPGHRVLVPFGSRRLEGYVIALAGSSQAAASIRDIIEVLDPDPVLNEEAISLARWMSETYLCSFVTALRVLMPANARKRQQPAWRVLGTEAQLRAALQELKVPGHVAGDILRNLLSGVAVREETLHQQLPGYAWQEIFKKLNRLKLIIKENRSPSPGTSRAAQAFFLVENREVLLGIAKRLASKAPRQADALEILLTSDGCPMTELLKKGCTRGSLKALVDKGLIKMLEAAEPEECIGASAAAGFKLTEAQQEALEAIRSKLREQRAATFLLHGITASGKTEVYLRAIEEVREMGRQAIVLVPEIALTPQTAARFRSRFGRHVAVLHSGLSPGERSKAWHRIKRGEVSIAIGPRSAVFAPFPRLGLIVIDEEHETTYKQDTNPKYHTSEVARKRAEAHNAVVLLASATPSVESFYQAAAKENYQLITIYQRATSHPVPAVTVVDMRQELREGNTGILSRPLYRLMQEILGKGEQVMLFLNRRGYASSVVCRNCGHVVKCPNCDVGLTYHTGTGPAPLLRCHYCGYRHHPPRVCPACGSSQIRAFGVGTERVEQEAARLFPKQQVLRMDLDSTGRKGSHEAILDAFQAGKANILVGTQMIAKGLDFPHVTLVGVISADTTLNLPDFRARERTFQLLVQVAGRAGRGEKPGSVIIQTYAPENSAVIAARSHDYRSFYQEEILYRQAFGYPPFTHLIRVIGSCKQQERLVDGMRVLLHYLARAAGEAKPGSGVELLGPAPAPLSRLQGSFRWQIMLKGPDLLALRQVTLQGIRQFIAGESVSNVVNLGLEVDPSGIF